MRKVLVIFIVIAAALTLAFISTNKPPSDMLTTQTPTPTGTTNVDIKASFTIITGSITRNFSAEKYHNKSQDVYIENPDPSVIYVTKTGITWDDFFKTLPMKLTKDCLITGDSETLCERDEKTLKFFLNDAETPNLLGTEIKNGDRALIIFN